MCCIVGVGCVVLFEFQEVSLMLVVFAMYFVIVLCVALYGFRVTRNHADYILGGRSLSGVVAAMGVGASDMSGWLMLALPGLAYVSGISALWMPLGLSIGAYINWRFIAQRLRIYTELADDALTIPAYFENRFADHPHYLRCVTAMIILLFFTVYAAAGFVGGAKLFAALFDMPYLQALYVSAPFVIIYTCVAGFLVVNWLDLFQGSLMLFALLLVPIVAVFSLGGVDVIVLNLHQLSGDGHYYLDAFSGLNVIGLISLLAWGLGYFGQPHILVRFMAAKSPADLTTSRKICMTWMVLSLMGSISIGLIGVVYFSQTPLSNAETVFLELVNHLLPPALIGLMFAAVLSAIMSTISAQLLASSSALAEDFYHTFLRKAASEIELLWVARATVILVAMIAFFIATDPESNILSIVSHAWAGLGAAFGPIIVCSLYCRQMTRRGALLGMLFGTLGVLIWNGLSSQFAGIFDLYEIVPGFLCNLLGIYLGNRLSRTPDQAMLEQFDRYQEKLGQLP